MPAGSTPPLPGLPQAVFDALKPMTYNASSRAFVDAGGALIYMFVEKKTGGTPAEGQWFYATDADGRYNPRGNIPQLTYDVIHGGTYDRGKVAYGGQSYSFRLARDAGGVHVGEAVVV